MKLYSNHARIECRHELKLN